MTTSRSRRFNRRDSLLEIAWGADVPWLKRAAAGPALEARDALRDSPAKAKGVCADCGKRIPAARLRIIPDATRCVPCQEALEAKSGAA
ncbi:MAG: TraR/DksA C4-type zinc finger protein [Phycisphaerae bacterium]|nr:TraR/DksA C4-type zinc finger protein [Phycisphaerae bacterium]